MPISSEDMPNICETTMQTAAYSANNHFIWLQSIARSNQHAKLCEWFCEAFSLFDDAYRQQIRRVIHTLYNKSLLSNSNKENIMNSISIGIECDCA